MKNYIIKRTDGIFEIALIKHKTKNKYSFVNLTKGHICPCEFDTVEEAEEDFKNYNNIIEIYESKNKNY